MDSQKGETPQCANTNGVSMSVISEKTNMNIVATSEFNFQGFSFNTVSEAGAVWFTSTDLAKALGYKKTDAISQIYARNSDEFTKTMSMTLNMRVNGINNSLRNKSVRIYSLRGAHLIAMFATTDKAKEFRRWVLDILDREVSASPDASPMSRYYTKVVVRDTMFGADIEFIGKADSLNKLATGICKTLGYSPNGFTEVEIDAARIKRVH